MRRKLSIKVAGCLVGALGVLVPGVHFLHAYQMTRNAATLLTHADREAAAGNQSKSIQYLERYLALVPDDTDALARLGLALEVSTRNGKGRLRVFELFEQVLRRDPSRQDVRRQLVHVAMDFGRFTDAIEHLKTLEQAFPDQGDLEYLHGQCDEAEGRYKEAEAWFKKAIAHSPGFLDSYVRLADLYRQRLNKPQDADKAMNDAVVKIKSFQAYLARSRYWMSVAQRTETGKAELLAKAEEDLKEARNLAPGEADVLLEMARLAAIQNNPEDARNYAREGVKQFPRDARMHLFLARFELASGRMSEAITCMRQGLEALPEDGELLYLLAETLIDTKQVAEAKDLMTRLRTKEVSLALVDYLSARIRMHDRQWLEAKQMLERIYSQFGRQPETARRIAFLQGQCAEQLGDADQQYTAYRQANPRDPQDPLWAPANDGMGRALMAMHRQGDAIALYRELMPRVPAARVVLARLLIQRNMGLPKAQRQWAEVDSLVAEAERLLPKSMDVKILKAQFFAAKEEYQKTQSFLLSVRDEDPTNVEAWIALAGLADQERKPETALSLLDQAEQQLGDHVQLRLARVRHWARRGTPEAGKVLARASQNLDHFSRDEQRLLLRSLAQAYIQIGDFNQADELYKQLEIEQPHSLILKVARFDLAAQADNEAEMQRLIRQMREIEGEDGTLWRYGQINLLIGRGRKGNKEALEEARPLITALSVRRPGWFRVATCQAQVEELAGRKEDAIKYYLQAVELGEMNPVVIVQALQLLSEAKRYAEADQLIRKLPEQAPIVNSLQNVAIEVSLRSGEYQRALTLAKKAVLEKPNDARSHLFLAQVRSVLGDAPEEVEVQFRRAIALAEKDPTPWVSFILYLARSDQLPKAKATIQEAQGKLSLEKDVVAFAQCYEAVGDLDQAKKLLAGALKARPSDIAVLQSIAGLCLRRGETGEAERHLRRILSFKNRSPAAAASARNLLGILVSMGQTDYQGTREALADLGLLDREEQRKPTGEDTIEDLRAKATVLAMQKGRSAHREAIRLLEAMRKRQPPTPADQFMLAQLYESVGDWTQARAEMSNLLAKQSDNPTYLVRFAQSLLLHDEAAAADALVTKLEQQPALRVAYQTIALRAQLLHKQDKNQEAVALLKEFVKDKETLTATVAALLERLGQVEAAEELYRKYADSAKKPESILVLAGFLSRQNRLPAALDLCEKAWSTCSPEAVATVSVGVLYAGKVTPDQRQNVERRLEAAIQANPKSTLLLEQLAAVRNWQRRYSEAEVLYRQAIERDPRNTLAMNNLAWLLAFQPGRTAEALNVLQRAMDIEGPLPDLLDTRGMVYLAAGNHPLAIQDLNEALAESPSAVGYFHLARVYFAAKDQLAARKALQQAQSRGLDKSMLQPSEHEAYEQLIKEISRS